MGYNTPYLRHLNYHLHLLLLVLALDYLPSTMAIGVSPGWNDDLPGGNSHPVHPNIQKYPYLPLAPANAPNKDQTNMGEQSIDEMNMPYCGAEYQCQCPPSSLIECPLTLEPEAYRQIKKNLGPVIRQRLKELLKKALTVESAIEAAHTIDLLKLLNESSTELNTVRENMQKGAQQLTDAFLKIPEIV
ncbi:hypothetical protein RHGRI_038950 [Rhododendron griersonianum]|uniref:Uncharacterized protein n=1 Tax=Rhododendron griersonianum TaxID=479676 RepID=A0AAV6HLX7_9ERIC|nr:hypothetical protein RHGRI_038950 [Rhododendron griersonianum]